MQTFYSIIKIAPNPIAGDTLAIGLLLRDENKFWLHFSDEKRSIAKKLMDGKGDTIDFVVKQIEHNIKILNKELSKKETLFFDLPSLITSEKMSFLSAYSNGVLRFSEPSFLNDKMDGEKFIKLFQLLVDKTFAKEAYTLAPIESKLHTLVCKNLISKVQNVVHTEFELNPTNLPGLYYNFNIDCIGLNGSFTAAKSIQFDKKFEAIDKELSHYFALMGTLNRVYPNRKNKNKDTYYIIGEEPTIIESKEHKTWENIKHNQAVTLINPEESAIVAEKIEKNKATKFIKEAA